MGAYISLTPFEISSIIAQAGVRFDKLGIGTRWLIADTSNIDGSVAFARGMLKNQNAVPYMGVFANHSWDSDSPDSDYLEVRQFALENGLETWCTEIGSNAYSWQKPERFPTYEYAVELARIYSRVLKLTGTTAVLYWEMMGSDYWINDGMDAYPSFHVIHQLGEQFPPGSVIVETSNNTETIYTVAAQASDHFVVFLVNTGEERLEVTVNGLPDGNFKHVQTTRGSQETVLKIYNIPGDTTTLELPAMSIHVLTTK